MVEFDEYQTDHSLPLLGLKLDTSYTVDVTFTDPDDNSVVSGSMAAVTGLLPVDVPTIDVLVNVPAQKEPGYTWLDRAKGYAFVFDEDAEIVWYSTISRGGTRKLQNGNLRWGNNTVTDSDLLGNVINSTVMQIPANPEAGLHHELFTTLYGTYVSLDREFVLVDDYPTSVTDPNAPTATKQLRDEPIVEFQADGTPLKRWPLIDVIEARRIYNGAEGTEPLDWAHTNAVVHDHRDDSLIVSARQQDCV
jgi:arylsulfate sulfotransferase